MYIPRSLPIALLAASSNLEHKTRSTDALALASRGVSPPPMEEFTFSMYRNIGCKPEDAAQEDLKGFGGGHPYQVKSNKPLTFQPKVSEISDLLDAQSIDIGRKLHTGEHVKLYRDANCAPSSIIGDHSQGEGSCFDIPGGAACWDVQLN